MSVSDLLYCAYVVRVKRKEKLELTSGDVSLKALAQPSECRS